MAASLLRPQAAWVAAGSIKELLNCIPAVRNSGMRCLASAADARAPAAAAAAASAAWRQRFDVAPGSILRFDFPHTASDISVSIGEHEAIEVAAGGMWAAVQLRAEQSVNPAHEGASVVAISQQKAAQQSSTNKERLQFDARAPSRFLTVEATTAGGSVHVEVINEGSLRLSTGGGSISAPKVKAVDAHLSSAGGAITGAVTGVDVQLSTGGGSLQLKSLVAKKARVQTGGGEVSLGACYADHLELDSGSGPMHVRNIDCRGGSATLTSGGGSVVIDSLDGNAEVQSQGGDVQVQLHDNAGHISIASSGGAIQLFLNPTIAGQLHLRSFDRLVLPKGAAAAQQPDGSMVLQLPVPQVPAGWGSGGSSMAAGGAPMPPLSRLQRAVVGGTEAGASISLDAGGSGSITVTQRDWMEALRQRWS